MTKPRRKGWPRRMYAVCYRDIDSTPSWVPYSGELFYYRDDAEFAASDSPENKRVMVVWVHPSTNIRRPRVKS